MECLLNTSWVLGYEISDYFLSLSNPKHSLRLFLRTIKGPIDSIELEQPYVWLIYICGITIKIDCLCHVCLDVHSFGFFLKKNYGALSHLQSS